jgi:GxxExxY protein
MRRNILIYDWNADKSDQKDKAVLKQQPIKVYYDEEVVGEYFADLIANNLVIIELKAAEGIAEEHECQLLNYLRATDKEVGLLLNFGKKPTFKRKAFKNENKNLR